MSSADAQLHEGVEAAISNGEFYESPSTPENGRVLFVFVPGWLLKPLVFKPLLVALMKEDFLAQCDLLPYKYNNSRKSNADPEQIACEISCRIEEAMERRSYSSIYVMGHSIGALLIRRALLIAQEKSHKWPSKTMKIVLLAGANRGFVPAKMRDRFGAFLVSAFRIPCGKLIMSMQRGSKWVTSLRMKWLEKFTGDVRPPDIAQIYGSLDDVIGEDDAAEINRLENSQVHTLDGVTHVGFATISDTESSQYRTIRDAFLTRLRERTLPRREEYQHLVFLIHGIRDFAEWQEALEFEIEQLDETVSVIPVQYGYFNILQFLFPHQQERARRVFVEKYVQEKSKSPSAKVTVGAHSNGTLVFAEAVRENNFIKANRVCLAGCVLPRQFSWAAYREQVGEVYNVCATSDWPVGILCRALQWIPFYRRTFGTAGYLDFEGKKDCRIKGGHGQALRGHYRVAVAKYLVGRTDHVAETFEDAPLWMKRVSPLSLGLLLLVVAILVGVYAAILFVPSWCWPWRDATQVALSAIWTFLVIVLLQKI